MKTNQKLNCFIFIFIFLCMTLNPFIPNSVRATHESEVTDNHPLFPSGSGGGTGAKAVVPTAVLATEGPLGPHCHAFCDPIFGDADPGGFGGHGLGIPIDHLNGTLMQQLGMAPLASNNAVSQVGNALNSATNSVGDQIGWTFGSTPNNAIANNSQNLPNRNAPFLATNGTSLPAFANIFGNPNGMNGNGSVVLASLTQPYDPFKDPNLPPDIMENIAKYGGKDPIDMPPNFGEKDPSELSVSNGDSNGIPQNFGEKDPSELPGFDKATDVSPSTNRGSQKNTEVDPSEDSVLEPELKKARAPSTEVRNREAARQRYLQTKAENDRILQNLRDRIQELGADLVEAKKEQKKSRDALEGAKKGDPFLGPLYRFVTLDDTFPSLEGNLQFHDRNVAKIQSNLDATKRFFAERLQRFRKEERLLYAEVVKSDPKRLQQLSEQRIQETIDLNVKLHNARVQFVAGHTVFLQEIIDEQALIEKAEADGQDLVVQELAKDQIERISQFNRYVDRNNGRISGIGNELRLAYARNAEEGIGPTSGQELRNILDSRGQDITGTLEAINKKNLEAAKRTAQILADKAEESTRQNMSVSAFLNDAAEEARRNIDEPDTGGKRAKAYVEGVGSGAKKVVGAVKSAGNLVGAKIERAVTGETGTFDGRPLVGLENFLGRLGLDFSGTVVGTTDQVIDKFDRDFARTAGRGDDLGAIKKVGEFVGEEATGEILGGFLARPLREAGLLSPLDKATDVSKLGRTGKAADTIVPDSPGSGLADNAGKAVKGVDQNAPTELITEVPKSSPGSQVAKVDQDAPTELITVTPDSKSSTGLPSNADDVGTVVPSNKKPDNVPNAAVDQRGSTGSSRGPPDVNQPATATSTTQGILTKGSDGTLVLNTPQFGAIPLKEVLNEGLTSTVYKFTKNGKDYVVKITKSYEGSAAAGKILDDYGKQVLKRIDPKLLPNEYFSQKIGDVAISIQDFVEDLSSWRKRRAKELGVSVDEVPIPEGYYEAIVNGTKKIVASSHAILDGKLNNIAIIPNPDNPGKFLLVIIDPGGIVPFITVDAAEAAMRSIYTPDAIDLANFQKNPGLHKDDIIGRFITAQDGSFDFVKFTDQSGLFVENLFAIPQTPILGLQLPGLGDFIRKGQKVVGAGSDAIPSGIKQAPVVDPSAPKANPFDNNPFASGGAGNSPIDADDIDTGFVPLPGGMDGPRDPFAAPAYARGSKAQGGGATNDPFAAPAYAQGGSGANPMNLPKGIFGDLRQAVSDADSAMAGVPGG